MDTREDHCRAVCSYPAAPDCAGATACLAAACWRSSMRSRPETARRSAARQTTLFSGPLDAPAGAENLPHHSDHRSPAGVVENPVQSPGEMVEVDRISFGNGGAVDQRRHCGHFQTETIFRNLVQAGASGSDSWPSTVATRINSAMVSRRPSSFAIHACRDRKEARLLISALNGDNMISARCLESDRTTADGSLCDRQVPWVKRMKRRAMGYRYYRGSWAAAVMQLAEPSVSGLIERRAGLVEEQIIGPAQQGPADRQALFRPGLRGESGR